MTKPVKQVKRKTRSSSEPQVWWMNPRTVAVILAVGAFLMYINSLVNGFVLDDSLVITKNAFTTKGNAGIGDIFSHDTFQGYYGESADEIKIIGGRYRPLSVAFFAFLYQVFGASPFAFHFWNVLLYSLCCVVLYRVLRYAFEPLLGAVTTAAFAALTTLFFVVHPVHTEVVNNIKSNDEILCLLLSLGSLFLALRYWDTRKTSLAIMSGLALFFACLAKENAVVFLAIIPFTIYFRSKYAKKRTASFLPLIVSLGSAFLVYFLIRYSILGWSLGEAPLDLINNPFIKYNGTAWEHVAFGEKLAMIFLSLGKYLLLLFFPFVLSTDYYPRYIDVVSFSNPLAILSLLAYLGLAVYAAYRLYKKQYYVHVYGIVFFLVALSIVSNIVFPIGTNLAERFLFAPSVGFSIVAGSIIIPFIRNDNRKMPTGLLIGAAVVLVIFAGRTFLRNFDFKSNRVLFEKDERVSAKSAKIQNGLGALIAEEALHSQDQASKMELSQRALTHLNKAIDIHPTYLEAFYMRGNVHFMMGQYQLAINDFTKTIQLNPEFKDVYPNYALALREEARALIETKKDVPKAIGYLEESLKLYPNEKETSDLLAKARQSNQPN